MYKLSTVLACFLMTTFLLAGCDVNIPTGSLTFGYPVDREGVTESVTADSGASRTGS